MKYLRSCLWALCVLWHTTSIDVRLRKRLWLKSVKLFISCFAFADTGRPRQQIQGAMVNALLTSLYDFDTDIAPIASRSHSSYLYYLERLVSDVHTYRIGERLFLLDLQGQLSPDGLERGKWAFEFYFRVIGSVWLASYSPDERYAFGCDLQRLDDALDIRKDREAGDKNCFLGDQPSVHVVMVGQFLKSPFMAELQQRSLLYRLYFPHRWKKVQVGLKVHTKESALMATQPIMDAALARACRQEVRDQMMLTRPGKYEAWFSAIDQFKLIARAGDRCSFMPFLRFFEEGSVRADGIDALYSGIHAVDDVADGDREVPEGFENGLAYTEHMMEVVRGSQAPRDAVGRLILYGLSELTAAGADLTEEMFDILETLRFDARRRAAGLYVLVDEDDLLHQCYLRDERGTIGGCLKALREHRVTIEDIAPLGRAAQIAYSIRDMPHDMLKMMINVSRQDFRRHAMYMPDPTENAIKAWIASGPVRHWQAEQAMLADRFSRQYDEHRPGLRTHFFTSMVLRKGYQREIGEILRKVPLAA